MLWHIQCTCNMHHLGELGHAPIVKIFETIQSEIAFEAFFGHKYILPECSLHVHMKVIAHTNNWPLTLAFHVIFTQETMNFMWAQAQVCPGVATPLMCDRRSKDLISKSDLQIFLAF